MEPEKRRASSFQINSILGGLKLAEEGLGIISLPSNYPGLKTSCLKEVLPEVSEQWLIYIIFFLKLSKIIKMCRCLVII
jgi:hypothetical protein